MHSFWAMNSFSLKITTIIKLLTSDIYKIMCVGPYIINRVQKKLNMCRFFRRFWLLVIRTCKNIKELQFSKLPYEINFIYTTSKTWYVKTWWFCNYICLKLCDYSFCFKIWPFPKWLKSYFQILLRKTKSSYHIFGGILEVTLSKLFS